MRATGRQRPESLVGHSPHGDGLVVLISPPIAVAVHTREITIAPYDPLASPERLQLAARQHPASATATWTPPPHRVHRTDHPGRWPGPAAGAALTGGHPQAGRLGDVRADTQRRPRHRSPRQLGARLCTARPPGPRDPLDPGGPRRHAGPHLRGPAWWRWRAITAWCGWPRHAGRGWECYSGRRQRRSTRRRPADVMTAWAATR